MDFGVNFKITKCRMLGFRFIGSVGSYITGVSGEATGCVCVCSYFLSVPEHSRLSH